MAPGMKKSTKLSIIIAISFSFFVAEIAVGFYTRSLALVADAFHYLNDLIGFVVALVAFKASERDRAPPALSFGWQRATLLGAFFNGVFLLALGVSIFLQSIERFVKIEEIQRPLLVIIIGCIGFALNVVSVTILHEHEHDVKKATALDPSAMQISSPHSNHRHAQEKIAVKKERDLGIAGVVLHIAGDAANNLGVILAGALILKLTSPSRFYADPAVSMAIAFMILGSSMPLVKRSGMILLQSVPTGVSPADVKHDMEQIPGVHAVHELHIWRLNQQKSLASAHVVVTDTSLADFMKTADTINECLHAYGIHSSTLQPEVQLSGGRLDVSGKDGPTSSVSPGNITTCLIGCQGRQCGNPSCCD